MKNKHTLSFGLRVCITYRAASLARRKLLLSATSDGLFMDELESITMTTSLYLGDTVAANSDLWKIRVSIITFKYTINWRLPLVRQELITLPGHMSWPLVFSGVRVTRSLVLCECFINRCLSICTFLLYCLFFFDIRIMIAPLVSSNSSWFSKSLKIPKGQPESAYIRGFTFSLFEAKFDM
jgi:hypothetical protein